MSGTKILSGEVAKKCAGESVPKNENPIEINGYSYISRAPAKSMIS
jgi:hypothetical protein